MPQTQGPTLTEEEKKKKKKTSIRDVKKILWGDKKSKKKLMDEIDNY